MKLVKFDLNQDGSITYPFDESLIKNIEIRAVDGNGDFTTDDPVKHVAIAEVPDDLDYSGIVVHPGTFRQNFIEEDDRPFVAEILITDVSGAGLYPDGFKTHDVPRTFRGCKYKWEIACRLDEQITVTATNIGPPGTWSTPLIGPAGHEIYVKTVKTPGAPEVMTITFTPRALGNYFMLEESINEELSQIRFAFAGARLIASDPT